MMSQNRGHLSLQMLTCFLAFFICVNNMGFLLQAKGDLEGAEPYYRRALEAREKVLGPEHPDLGHALNGIGNVYMRQRS